MSAIRFLSVSTSAYVSAILIFSASASASVSAVLNLKRVYVRVCVRRHGATRLSADTDVCVRQALTCANPGQSVALGYVTIPDQTS